MSISSIFILECVCECLSNVCPWKDLFRMCLLSPSDLMCCCCFVVSPFKCRSGRFGAVSWIKNWKLPMLDSTTNRYRCRNINYFLWVSVVKLRTYILKLVLISISMLLRVGVSSIDYTCWRCMWKLLKCRHLSFAQMLRVLSSSARRQTIAIVSRHS